MTRTRRRTSALAATLLLIGVVLVGCGSSDTPSTVTSAPSSAPAQPTTGSANTPLAPAPTGTAGAAMPAQNATLAPVRGSATTQAVDRPTTVPTPTGLPTLQSIAIDSDGDGFLMVEEMGPAMAAVFHEYQWPAGSRVTPEYVYEIFAKNFPADSGPNYYTFEVGYEYTVLNIWNSCVWEQAWVNAQTNGDAAGQTEALDALTNLVPTLPRTPAEISAFRTDIANRLSLGDPSSLIRDINLNCGAIPVTEVFT